MAIFTKKQFGNSEKQFTKILPILVFALIATACGGGGSTNPNSGNPGASTGSATVLEGNWVKPCGISDDTEPTIIYDVVTVNFTSNEFDSVIKNFTDANCSIEFAQFSIVTISGVFNLPSISVSTTNGLQAAEFNSRITQFSGAIVDDVEFDIFYLNADQLYFGNIDGAKDGSATALRPDTLDFNRGFIRQ